MLLVGMKIMNKLLLVEDINEINNGDFFLDYERSMRLRIMDKVCLANYSSGNYSLEIDVQDGTSLYFDKVDVLTENMEMVFNVGSKATLDFNWVILNNGHNKVKLIIKMLGNDSRASIKVRGINELDKGNLDIICEGIVQEKTIDNILVQDLKGLVINDDTIKISPKMIIGTNEVEANHLVTIGSFAKEDLFYLNSKGLSDDVAKKMLKDSFIRGILRNDLRKFLK